MSTSTNNTSLEQQLEHIASLGDEIAPVATSARQTIAELKEQLSSLQGAVRHHLNHAAVNENTRDLAAALSHSEHKDHQTCSVSRLWLTGLGEAFKTLIDTSHDHHLDPDHFALLEQLESYLGERIASHEQRDHQALVHSPWKAVAKEMAECLEQLLPRSHGNPSRCEQLIRHVRHDAPQLSYHGCTHSINPGALSPTLGQARRARLSAHITAAIDQLDDTQHPKLIRALQSVVDHVHASPLFRARVAHCLYTGNQASLVLSLDNDDAESLMSDPSLRWVWISHHHEDSLKI